MHWARQSLKKLPKDMRSPARLALMLIADYADEDHICWPSISTMAEEMGCSDRTVQRVIAMLVDKGLLQVESRHAVNGRQQSNRYRLAVGCQFVTPTTSANSLLDGEGDSLTPSEGDKLTGEGDTSAGGRVSPVSPLESTTVTHNPTHTPQANGSDHVQGANAHLGSGLDDSGQPLNGAADTHRKFAMHFDWEPSPEVFAAACLRAGLAPGTSYERPQLAKFTAYFADQPGRRHSESTWMANFVDWIRRDSRFAAQQPSAGGNRHANSSNHAGAGKRTRTAAEARREAEQRRAEQSGNGARAGFVYEGECSGHSGGH